MLFHQRRRPAQQGRKVADRPRRQIGKRLFPAKVLSTSVTNPHVVQTEFFHAELQPLTAASHGLNQSHTQIRPTDSQHQTGQPRSRTNIGDLHSLGQKLAEYPAVQKVAAPDATGLARSQQTLLQAFVAEQVRKVAHLVAAGVKDIGQTLRLRFKLNLTRGVLGQLILS